MKTVRERRDELAHHLMAQAVVLPRVGFTLMRIALWENAGVLLSNDPEGDEMLLGYEAENGMLGEDGKPGTPEPVLTEEERAWQQLVKDLKAASAKSFRQVMYDAMADVKKAREARDKGTLP